LYRDLLSRLPGKLYRIDGTFNFMKNTMDVPEASEKSAVQVKIAGEYNHLYRPGQTQMLSRMRLLNGFCIFCGNKFLESVGKLQLTKL
jgi:hypothetical protein